MNYKLIPLVMMLVVVLSACATATATRGRNFDSSLVSHIKNGETTTSDILTWFGEPYTRRVMSATEEIWTYLWVTSTANVRSGVLVSHVRSNGYMKNLSLWIASSIVMNHTFTEGPIEGEVRSRPGYSREEK